ncbi:hypothetical protein JCM19239_214 [Vibrio variabilis]|uniref:Uncharacterized protein n=1 Tax=Vibrio variabilis TaxID=990271 RepID=A0ABQ0JPM1_9VIBR|nr:hypothetical protein JCM19239_214 [Vibrio variabilis]
MSNDNQPQPSYAPEIKNPAYLSALDPAYINHRTCWLVARKGCS